MPLYNQEQIKEIIPHRDPFLLIDTVEELEPGIRVVATKHIREDEDWFRGHFPGHPVTPGVLVIEMLAQAGAVCALSPVSYTHLDVYKRQGETMWRQRYSAGASRDSNLPPVRLE